MNRHLWGCAILYVSLSLATPVAAAPIVVDDFSAGCELTGRWADNLGKNPEGKNFSSAGCIGGNYHYTSSHGAYRRTGKERATYRVKLPKPGRYRVEAGFRASENRSPKVTYEVTHKGGKARKVVNQRGSSNWADLGVFEFDAEAVVAMVSDGGMSASVDAVRLTSSGATITDGGAGAVSTGEPGGGPVATGSGSGRPGGLDDVLGTGGGKAQKFGAGKHTMKVPAAGTVRATACLMTYQGAALEVRVVTGDGKRIPWLSWQRANDKDPGLLEVEGKADAQSCREEKPGDFTAFPVTHALEVPAGAQLEIELSGDLAAPDGALTLEFVGGK